jgi:hypothetical protein
VASTTEISQLQASVDLAEQQLAERTQAARDLVTENEQLKGRVNDAEGLRADYVRLRTSATEAAFLKTEVARLEEQIRAMRRDSLGGQGRRPARGSEQPVRPSGSIGESLSAAIDRFSDPATRSIAIADAQGFPLASSGEDGVALAAFAALLIESGNRAGQLLPVAAPSMIEMVDEHGARISVWSFDVERERLFLVNLAVAPVDAKRVEATLLDLASILGPAAQGSREAR